MATKKTTYHDVVRQPICADCLKKIRQLGSATAVCDCARYAVGFDARVPEGWLCSFSEARKIALEGRL